MSTAREWDPWARRAVTVHPRSAHLLRPDGTLGPDPNFGRTRRDKQDAKGAREVHVEEYESLTLGADDLRPELARWYATLGYSAEQIADRFAVESLGRRRREVDVRTIYNWAGEYLAHARILRKARAEAERERERREQMWHILPCQRRGCPNIFLARRRDARYCGSACRQAAHRDAVTDKAAVSEISAISERGEPMTTAERDAVLARIDRLEGRLAEALNAIQWNCIALLERYPDDERVRVAAQPFLANDEWRTAA